LFSGMSNHAVDTKGRIILPASFRDELGESFFITRGFTECLQAISESQFEHLRDKIKELPADKALALQYIMIAPAVKVTPNSQGRISLPQALREELVIDKEAVVIGMDDRVEIWNKIKYDEFIKRQKQEVLAEALSLLKL